MAGVSGASVASFFSVVSLVTDSSTIVSVSVAGLDSLSVSGVSLLALFLLRILVPGLGPFLTPASGTY